MHTHQSTLNPTQQTLDRPHLITTSTASCVSYDPVTVQRLLWTPETFIDGTLIILGTHELYNAFAPIPIENTFHHHHKLHNVYPSNIQRLRTYTYSKHLSPSS